MTWFIFSISCAIFEALKDLNSKRGLEKLDPLLITWLFFLLTTCMCAPILFFQEFPKLNSTYFYCLIAHGAMYGLSVYIYMKAISISKLELSVPLIMFTPAFILISAPVTLGEFPNLTGIIGTFLIVIGAYLLKIDNLKYGLLAPIRALLEERGSRLMLLVALIWSFTSIVDKIGIRNSNPIFWGITLYAFISFYLTILVLFKRRNIFRTIQGNFLSIFKIGIYNSLQMLSYVFALNLGQTAYVLALKRTSVLFIMIFSFFSSKETAIFQKFFAAFVMFIGVVLILLT
jgi:uncharacterized membrane protein